MPATLVLHSSPRTFDLVVGADGIHSTVRKLAFGPESDYVAHLGYYYALADLDGGGGGPDVHRAGPDGGAGRW